MVNNKVVVVDPISMFVVDKILFEVIRVTYIHFKFSYFEIQFLKFLNNIGWRPAIYQSCSSRQALKLCS
jgi:hypothetical protein